MILSGRYSIAMYWPLSLWIIRTIPTSAWLVLCILEPVNRNKCCQPTLPTTFQIERMSLIVRLIPVSCFSAIHWAIEALTLQFNNIYLYLKRVGFWVLYQRILASSRLKYKRRLRSCWDKLMACWHQSFQISPDRNVEYKRKCSMFSIEENC